MDEPSQTGLEVLLRMGCICNWDVSLVFVTGLFEYGFDCRVGFFFIRAPFDFFPSRGLVLPARSPLSLSQLQ